MRRVQKLAVMAMTASLALAATACGSKPDDKKDNANPSASSGTGGGGAKSDFKACMVTDMGGIDDRSFNASSWAALEKAKKDLGITTAKAESKAETDYAVNLNSMLGNGCGIIVPVGGLMADATKAAAAQKKDQKFAIVDSNSIEPNVQGLEYNTAEAAFLAGYLAAGYTKTGKVATFGGLKIPPVTVYMDGFWEGVQHYNQVKGKSVQVLGWDETKKEGSIAGSFIDQAKGSQITNDFIAQGADIILPVAGQTGLGAASAAKNSGGKANIIWVDTDGFESAATYKDVFITTVAKDITGAVYKSVKEASEGKFVTTPYIGTLANGGVSLSPFHDFESKVPTELKAEVDKVKADIIAGTIKIKSENQPKK